MLKDQFGRNTYDILTVCLLFISMECSSLVEINNIHISSIELHFLKTFIK